MPPAVKGSPQERENFMADVFRQFYQDPANAGKELSIEKANAAFRKKYNSMLRNRKAYQIRQSVKARLMGSGGPSEHRAFRSANETAHDGTKTSVALVEGTPDQIAWLQRILPQLIDHGLAQAKIEHSTETYAVLVRL